jgi:hypothetical protein
MTGLAPFITLSTAIKFEKSLLPNLVIIWATTLQDGVFNVKLNISTSKYMLQVRGELCFAASTGPQVSAQWIWLLLPFYDGEEKLLLVQRPCVPGVFR